MDTITTTEIGLVRGLNVVLHTLDYQVLLAGRARPILA